MNNEYSEEYFDHKYICSNPEKGLLPLLDNTVISKTKSSVKVIQSGKRFEIYIVDYPYEINKEPIPRSIVKREKSARNEEYKIRNAYKARKKIQRLVNTNFANDKAKFITLTFKDTHEFDITDLDECLKKYRYFIKQLKDKFELTKYITVVEYQKRGAVHYHIVCDLPYIKKQYLDSLWGYGFTWIKKLKPHNIGLYLSKYITKEAFDERFEGRRRYYTSKGLDQPKVYYNFQALRLACFLIRYAKLKYITKYESEYNGSVVYGEFIFFNDEEGG